MFDIYFSKRDNLLWHFSNFVAFQDFWPVNIYDLNIKEETTKWNTVHSSWDHFRSYPALAFQNKSLDRKLRVSTSRMNFSVYYYYYCDIFWCCNCNTFNHHGFRLNFLFLKLNLFIYLFFVKLYMLGSVSHHFLIFCLHYLFSRYKVSV